MPEIARRVTARAQFIFICGRNKKLADRLRGMDTRFPKYVEEFTSEIPYYMHLSDFFIGKPGPGSISEAIAMHLTGDGGAQRVDASAGTLQHRVDS